MKKVRDIFHLPIEKGHITWFKVQQQLHAVLQTVGHKFDFVKDANGNKTGIKLEDAVNINCKIDEKHYIYKLYKVRFLKGHLYCSGFELGEKINGVVLMKPLSKVAF